MTLAVDPKAEFSKGDVLAVYDAADRAHEFAPWPDQLLPLEETILMAREPEMRDLEDVIRPTRPNARLYGCGNIPDPSRDHPLQIDAPEERR